MKLTSKSPWEAREKLKIGLFHTLTGPIIGRVGKQTKGRVTVFAPARLQLVSPTKVLYHPIAFVDEQIDLVFSGFLGESPVPAVIAEGYLGYFKEFAKGGFLMMPIVISAGVDASEAGMKAMQHDMPGATPEGAVPSPPPSSAPFEEEEKEPAPPAAPMNGQN